jgi:diguanylate cyclase (GGDEF)-like protein
MGGNPMRILIADDDATSLRFLESTLVNLAYQVIATGSGVEALAILQSEETPPLAILDVMMPALGGLEVCRRVRQTDRALPTYIILLTAKRCREAIVAGLEAGADDYLMKPFDRGELHARIKVGARIRQLQERLADRVKKLEHAQAELRQLSLTDDLTGLWNRRGFVVHVEHHLKLARRLGKDSMLFYADMDGLKQINDTLGHREGSLAIIGAAESLTKTFRNSDIIARLGGDEFAVLESEITSLDSQSISARLDRNIKDYNRNGLHNHELSLSLGVVRVAAQTSATIEELVAQADRLMYEDKLQKRLCLQSQSYQSKSEASIWHKNEGSLLHRLHECEKSWLPN